MFIEPSVNGSSKRYHSGLKSRSTIVWAGQNVPEVFRAKERFLVFFFHENA